MGTYEGRGETCFVGGVPANFGMKLFPDQLDQLDQLLLYLETAIERIPLLATAGVRSGVNGPQPNRLMICSIPVRLSTSAISGWARAISLVSRCRLASAGTWRKGS